MKKLIITLGIAVLIGTAATAQTFNGNYKLMATDHIKNGERVSRTEKYKAGILTVTSQDISIDGERYTILKQDDKLSLADENYYTKTLIVVSKGKTGSYKVMDCVLLLKPNKSFAEVIFKKTKSTRVSYVIQD